jgi:hypothetical protein
MKPARFDELAKPLDPGLPANPRPRRSETE